MKIAKIDTLPLRIPFKPGTRAADAAWGGKDLPADSLLVKVTTDDGLIGWGEAFGFRAVQSAKLAVDELIGPLLYPTVKIRAQNAPGHDEFRAQFSNATCDGRGA